MLGRKPIAHIEYPDRFEVYIKCVESVDILLQLKQSKQKTIDFFKSVPVDKADYAYAAGKWTIKEVLLHLIDTERIMAYRGLRIARADKTPIVGFEQDDYVATSGANERTMFSLITEYDVLRDSSIAMYTHFSDDMWAQTGIACGDVFSVLASAYVIAGHERHHIRIIEERYL